MMLHLDLQRFGWVKKKELGRVFEAAIFVVLGSVVLAFFCDVVFFTMFALNVYVHQHVSFCLKGRNMQKKTDKTDKTNNKKRPCQENAFGNQAGSAYGNYS